MIWIDQTLILMKKQTIRINRTILHQTDPHQADPHQADPHQADPHLHWILQTNPNQTDPHLHEILQLITIIDHIWLNLIVVTETVPLLPYHPYFENS